jgi:apolipoprotein N-acyltransferase
MGAGLRLGISICYEDCFPELSRSDARRGAALLVNLTNDSWFRRSPEARQHLALAAFRAVETRRPLVRATNTGISALVSANGSIAVPAHGGLWEKGLVRMSPVVPVAGRRAETIYVLWGDFFGWGCSGLVLLTALVGAFWSGKRSQPGRPG